MKPIFKPLLDYLATATPAEIRQLADSAGVSIHTVMKIKRGEIEDPGVSKVERLVLHLPRRRKVNATPAEA